MMRCIRNGKSTVALDENKVQAIRCLDGVVQAVLKNGISVDIVKIDTLDDFALSERVVIDCVILALSEFFNNSDEASCNLREIFEETLNFLK